MHYEKKKNENEIRVRIQKYCATQERCTFDVKKKLNEWDIKPELSKIIIKDLIAENFINEERFAILFANSKLRIRKWGRIKIKHEMKKKFLQDSDIIKGIDSIDLILYKETLQELLIKKSSVKEQNIFKKKQKIINYLVQKGFEYELVWEHLNNYTDK